MEKNKELTPMQELIEICETIMENANHKIVYDTANLIRFRAESELKPKEKQVIEDAYTSKCDFMSCENKKQGCK